jgi:hypothetical protein
MKSLSELAALAFEDPSYWNIPSEAPINAQLPSPNQKVAGLTITSLLMWILRGNKNISEAVTSGRTAHASWREAHDNRLFVACSGGRLRLTDKGTDYLAEGVLHS